MMMSWITLVYSTCYIYSSTNVLIHIHKYLAVSITPHRPLQSTPSPRSLASTPSQPLPPTSLSIHAPALPGLTPLSSPPSTLEMSDVRRGDRACHRMGRCVGRGRAEKHKGCGKGTGLGGDRVLRDYWNGKWKDGRMVGWCLGGVVWGFGQGRVCGLGYARIGRGGGMRRMCDQG